MPSPEVKPPQATTTPNEQPRAPWRLNRTATFLATATLAVLTGTPAVKRMEVSNPFGEDPVTETQPGAQQPGAAAEEAIVAAMRTLDERPGRPAADEVWARQFAGDPEAGKLTGPEQLERVGQRIKDLQGEGYQITAIRLEGHASDEDDTVDANGQRTGGLRKPSAKNRQLAAKRAHEFKPQLEAYLEEQQIKGVPEASFVTPVEDMLSRQEKRQVGEMAAKLGYDRPVNLIEDYNRGQDLPAEVSEALDGILAKERKVEVIIESVKPGEAVAADEDKHLDPGDEVPGAEQNQPGREDKIPLYIPLLFPVPIFSRRKQSATQPEEQLETIPIAELPVATISRPPEKLPESPRGYDLKQAIARAAIRNARVPLVKMPARAKDEAYKASTGPVERTLPVARIRKQPRPHNMHGTRGHNHHLGRNKGGNRSGRR